MLKAKITVQIELENGQIDKLEFNDYEITWSHERGKCTILNEHGHTVDLQPTKHQRFCIKGWKGCESYDAFIKEQLQTSANTKLGKVPSTTQP